MNDEKILPVEEMVAYEEFTGRVEILRELDGWVKNIQRMGAWSTAIIAPRRLGKTVLLDRLVNTVFFKPEYRVAPFYFRMKREQVTLQKFLFEYATTFFRQYVAYCQQDPVLYRNSSVELEDLLDIQSTHSAVDMAKQHIERFVKRYHSSDHENAWSHWEAFITVPEFLASLSGTRVAVIIDEFQDMKFFVHDVDEQTLRNMGDKLRPIKLTSTFNRQAQSRKAPMLVSGSAVTMIFRTVMGGPLGGRFGFKYLKPLSIPDGATLLQILLKLYANNSPISTENALYASSQVEGHPYYLYCLSVSEYEDKQFNSTAEIDRLIQYEIRQGKIYGFWQTHFEDNRRYINADDDEELGKKIIYYFTKYNNQPVDTKSIAAKLQVTKKAVEQKIEKLYQADLVYRSAAKFYTFNDICLMRFIKFVYQQDLEGLEDIDLSQQNLFNNLKGRFLEIVVQVTMMKFNHEQLDGALFGRSGEVDAPLFQIVDTKYAKASTTPSYQLDVCGQVPNHQLFWVCECKYTKTKMGLLQVHKLEKAVETLKQQIEEAGQPVPQMQLWLVSTGGFTGDVLEYVKDRADIYYSDHEGINGIFRAYGGNYNIPIFKGE
jgi:predicted AAA+ superfamily ATPase